MRRTWRKGRDSNPRYGRAVYRISSPAHSTSLPPFRTIGAMNFIRMQINLLLAFYSVALLSKLKMCIG